MLGNNASHVTDYPVLESLSPGDFFFAIIILVGSYNFNEKNSKDLTLY